MPHYNNAPITEAVIDIRVQSPPSLRFEDLDALKVRFSDYPHQERRTLATATFNFGPSSQAVAKETPFSLVFTNEAKNQVVQAGVQGFTFSRLAKYQSFPLMRDEARRLWDIYREFVGPTHIARVALRYINLFNFPEKVLYPEQYLNTFPHISPVLPKNLAMFDHFLLNLRLPQPDLGPGAFMVINETGAPPSKPDVIPFILDLDLFIQEPSVTNEQQLWEVFDRLRLRKNEYFEASITEKTRNLIR